MAINVTRGVRKRSIISPNDAGARTAHHSSGAGKLNEAFSKVLGNCFEGDNPIASTSEVK